MIDHLSDTYDLDLPERATLSDTLMALAEQYAEENLEEAMDGLSYEIHDTFLEDLGDDAIRFEFRNLLTNSTYYMLYLLPRNCRTFVRGNCVRGTCVRGTRKRGTHECVGDDL